KMDSAPGWKWVLAPQRKNSKKKWSEGGVVCLVEAEPMGGQLLYLAYSARFDPNRDPYRPVFFDAAGKRYLPTAERGGNSTPAGRALVPWLCYRLDRKTLPQDEVTYIGVEANVGGSGK